ncbi:hypothetical protein JCM17961_19420 [Endothiovibrio diazotrophicus]
MKRPAAPLATAEAAKKSMVSPTAARPSLTSSVTNWPRLAISRLLAATRRQVAQPACHPACWSNWSIIIGA